MNGFWNHQPPRIDTQRFWHAAWHPGPEPRYNLITSWESGSELDA